MAEGSRYALNPQLDIKQLVLEAKSRWLRPSEVCEILRNYQRFRLTSDPPHKPPGGSLFLFDRKALRYFRKDGHCWRKKKDGKTVREAHEKLKSGSVDVLHCYYAHGEDNENFQRRSYWLLDGQLEHIVLVHYREVNEGSRPGNTHPLNTDSGTQSHTQVAQTTIAAQTSYASSPSTVDWNGRTLSSEFEDVDSGDDFGASSLAESISGSGFHITSSLANVITDKNISVSRTSDSQPCTRGSIDGAGSSRPFSPFYETEVGFANPLPYDGQQTNYGVPQEADFPKLSREHLGAGSFAGGSFSHDTTLPMWPGFLGFNQKITGLQEQKVSFNRPNCTGVVTREMADSFLDASGAVKYGVDGRFEVLPDTQTLAREDGRLFQEKEKKENVEQVDKCLINDVQSYQVPNEHHFQVSPLFKNNSRSHLNVTVIEQPLKVDKEDFYVIENAPESGLHNDEQKGLKKLDSFGRWMNTEIGKDCDDSLMATDSGIYWNALDTQNENKSVSGLSCHMQLHIDSLGPSLSQEQLFSILDFSPDWAYSGIGTKVLVSGTFLGGIKPSSIKWCCMFGEIEVSAEVLTTNVLRCQAPAHSPGRVPFYITCSNRLACSEIREFEYRENLTGATFSLGRKSEPKDEVHLQIRFAKMLSLGIERKKVACSVVKCCKCSLENDLFSMLNDGEFEWDKIEKNSKAFEGYPGNTEDALIQKLLKSRLYEWLVSKIHEDGKGPNVLDEEGQGVIHLAAALGYEWAMGPIVAAGISPSFRDAHGRSGLHWAAYFGREETVATLVWLGAAPGAVEDPTSKFPEGRTAADLASSRGHKGIAGYLAEADLTSHLSSLSVEETVMESVSATLAAEKAIETAEKHTIVPLDGDRGEELSLRGSLAAVRNSAQAAARIQAAFRVHSFRQREQMKSSDEDSEIASEAVLFSSLNSKIQKIGRFSDFLHMAAVKIQQKYRGWKGRKEYLKIRNRIVKIQAHVRGHQVRKQYKKVVWSVGIVEKAILRWRRKGAGLRGFRAEKATGDAQPEAGKMDEYDFLRFGRKQKVAGVEKALARVQSMVRYPEARDQYMRLVASSQKTKLGDEDRTSVQVISSEEENKVEEDLIASMID